MRQQSSGDSLTEDVRAEEDEQTSPNSSNPADAAQPARTTGEDTTYDSVSVPNSGSQVVFMQVERNPWEGIYGFRSRSTNASDDLEQQAATGTASETSSLLRRNESNSS